MKKIFTIVAIVAIFQACTAPIADTNENSNPIQKPKNIILMIGDGMGPIQLQAAMLTKSDKLNLERMPYSGFSKTSSSNNLITDSAAGGTALSSGEKTYNGAIGVDSLGKPLETILEIAAGQGYATGIIATSSITHATPASFYAHQSSRKLEDDIAMDLLNSEVDIFMGGGSKFFNSRKDSLNLIDSLVSRNYFIAKDVADIKNAGNKKVGLLIAENATPPYLEGRGEFLPQATKSAIEYLSSSDKGFFLMVEGSQIDWGGHDNSKDYAVSEMIDFDNAVGQALEFAEKNGNTLIIVTADHETGGMTITGGNEKDFEVSFSSKGHTAAMVPVFAYGPGAEMFTGIMENTEIFHKMMKAWQLKNDANASAATDVKAEK